MFILVIFHNRPSNSRIKDEIFDWDTLLNFQGETGPYVQYIYVRTKSILEKAGYIPEIKDVDGTALQDEASIKVLKLLYNFGDVVLQSAEKNEPSIVARYLIDLSQSFSNFYTVNKVITEDKKTQDARLYLTYACGLVIKTGMELLGIKMPDKM